MSDEVHYSAQSLETDVSRVPRHTRGKSPLLILTVFFLWLVPLIYFGPRIWSIIKDSENPAQLILFSVSALFVAIFWLIAAHLTATVIFSFLPSVDGEYVSITSTLPSIAILYTVCDDFQHEAALSCINQDYPRFTVFLLDDSTSPSVRTEVDTFQRLHAAQSKVLRRTSRQGYKAGNLNAALGDEASEYEFFVLADADEVLPSIFLKTVVPYFKDPAIAFVQANHTCRYDTRSRFANDLALTGEALWEIVCRPKNRFGLVVCLGHGVIVRRSAWEAVGGFPEVVSEDFAFTALAASEGWKGLYLPDLYCFEEFPSDFRSFKRRQEKYVVGVAETLLLYTGRFLRSRSVTITEKVDYLIWTAPLFIPALCLLFLLLSTVATAAIGVQPRSLMLRLPGRSYNTPPIALGNPSFGPLIGWDFEAMSGVCGLSPAFACMALCLRRGIRVLPCLRYSIVPYMSLMVVSWRGLTRLILRGFTFFVSTGDRRATAGSTNIASSTPWHWQSPRKTEILLGIFLTIASIAWLNFGYIGISATLWIGAYVERRGWDAKLTRVLLSIVFSLIIFQYILIAFGPVVASWGP